MSPVKFHDNTAIHWYLPEVGFRTPHRYQNIQIYVPYIERCSICIRSLHSLLCILSLLLLSHFSRVQLCATPEMAAHQAPPSLGFPRQEHWSELPFPSPIRERERWKWSPSVVQLSVTPWTNSLAGSSVHGIFQARVLEWGAIAFSDFISRLLIIPNTIKMLSKWLLECAANSSFVFLNFLNFFYSIFNLQLVESTDVRSCG